MELARASPTVAPIENMLEIENNMAAVSIFADARIPVWISDRVTIAAWRSSPNVSWNVSETWDLV